MNNTFTINNVTYRAKECDFNTICDLEELGIDLTSVFKKPMSAARGYFSICSGLSIADSGKQMEEHITNGGDMGELIEVFLKELQASSFFQKMINKGKELQEAQTQTQKKNTKK